MQSASMWRLCTPWRANTTRWPISSIRPCDGIVTGLRLMSRMAQTRSSLAALAEPMQTLPQVLINVQVADKATVADAPSVRSAVAEAEAELGDSGRILLRPSGTEQVVRVMVEAADEDTARQVAVRVAESVSDQR